MKSKFLIVALFTMLACSKSDPGFDYSPYQKELDKNRAVWTNQSIAHYKFDYTLSAYTLDNGIRFTVEVTNNTITSIFSNETNSPVDIGEHAFIKTLDGFFDQIQQAINKKVYKISINYDAAKGFPSLIDVDEVKDIADDEYTIHLADLVVL